MRKPYFFDNKNPDADNARTPFSLLLREELSSTSVTSPPRSASVRSPQPSPEVLKATAPACGAGNAGTASSTEHFRPVPHILHPTNIRPDYTGIEGCPRFYIATLEQSGGLRLVGHQSKRSNESPKPRAIRFKKDGRWVNCMPSLQGLLDMRLEITGSKKKQHLIFALFGPDPKDSKSSCIFHIAASNHSGLAQTSERPLWAVGNLTEIGLKGALNSLGSSNEVPREEYVPDEAIPRILSEAEKINNSKTQAFDVVASTRSGNFGLISPSSQKHALVKVLGEKHVIVFREKTNLEKERENQTKKEAEEMKKIASTLALNCLKKAVEGYTMSIERRERSTLTISREEIRSHAIYAKNSAFRKVEAPGLSERNDPSQNKHCCTIF